MTATLAPESVRTEILVPASSRLSILVGDNHQIDLLLPAAVPLWKLTEPTRDVLNQRLRAIGAEELPLGTTFVFARAAGMTLLAGNLSLAAQGVTDADLLAFIPAEKAQRYEPNIENVSTAIARWAKRHFPAVSVADSARVGVALTLVALVVAGALVWHLRWGGRWPWLAPALFGGTAAALAGAAALAARMGAERYLTGAALWGALGALVAGAATAPPGPHPGAPHVFLAAAVAVAGTVVLARLTGRYWTAVTAVATVAVALGCAAATRMFFDVPLQRIAVTVLIGVITASYLASSIGRRLARVPAQSFDSVTGKDMYERAPGDPEDTIAPVADGPRDITLTGEQVAQVARRSNQVLMGVLLGVALVQVAASWWAIAPAQPSQWRFVVVAATVAYIQVMRARGFRDRRHAITVVSGAALSLFAIPAHFGLAAAPDDTMRILVSAAAVVGIAVAALAAGAIVPRRMFSEPVREVVEYSEYVAVVAVVVFAAWAIELLQFTRYH